MRAPLALALVLIGAGAALAQPLIAPNQLPGRERERFFDRFKSPDDLRQDRSPNPRLRHQEPRGDKIQTRRKPRGEKGLRRRGR